MGTSDKGNRMGSAEVARLGPPASEEKPTSVTTERSDDPVARALERGDRRGAIVHCARLHGDAIGRLCMALTGSQADAEDLAQETLLAAYDGIETWRREGSIKSWLFTIARRKCARLLERRARRTARLRLVHDAERDREPNQAIDLAARERAEQARHALDGMRPSAREALLLRFQADLSYREVAEVCGIDEATARKRVSRAIGAMRQFLTGQTPMGQTPMGQTPTGQTSGEPGEQP